MRTVKEPRNEKQHKVECRHCGAVMECAPSEMRFETDRDGRSYVLDCPHCHRETWLDAALFENRGLNRRLLTEDL